MSNKTMSVEDAFKPYFILMNVFIEQVRNSPEKSNEIKERFLGIAETAFINLTTIENLIPNNYKEYEITN